jgi:hypothetical protein
MEQHLKTLKVEKMKHGLGMNGKANYMSLKPAVAEYSRNKRVPHGLMDAYIKLLDRAGKYKDMVSSMN